MSTRPFAHLHCHSHYSLLDGAGTISRPARADQGAGMNCPGPDRPRQPARGAEVLSRRPRNWASIRSWASRPTSPPAAASTKKRQRLEGGQLPSHAAGPEPHRLSEPREALVGGLSGRVLFQAPHRQGIAGRPQRRADLPERLRFQRAEPRPAGRRRGRHGKGPSRSAAWYPRASSATDYFIEIQNNGLESQRIAMEGAVDVANRHGPAPGGHQRRPLRLPRRRRGPGHPAVRQHGQVPHRHQPHADGDQRVLSCAVPEEMYAAFPGLDEAVARSRRKSPTASTSTWNWASGTFPSTPRPTERPPRIFSANCA